MQMSDEDIKNFVDSQTEFKFKLFKNCISLYENQIITKNIDTSLFLIYTTIENVVHLIACSETEVNKEDLIKELVKMILKYADYEI